MGIKAKKVKLSAKGQKITRYESRWLRRLIRSERRFVKFLKTHFVSEYGESITLLELATNPKYGWEITAAPTRLPHRKMLVQRADSYAAACTPIMTPNGKPPKE